MKMVGWGEVMVCSASGEEGGREGCWSNGFDSRFMNKGSWALRVWACGYGGLDQGVIRGVGLDLDF